MQKILIAFLCGALVASGVWLWIGRNASARAEQAISEIQAQRDSAIATVGKLERELGEVRVGIGKLEEEVISANSRYRELLDSIGMASSGIADELREYGRINRDFRTFLETNKQSE